LVFAVRWLSRVLFAFAGFAASWAMLEGLFRIVPNYYGSLVRPGEQARGPWHRQGIYSWIGEPLSPRRHTPKLVTWNSHGWNDVEHQIPKPSGVVRIVVLGDSFVEAIQVPLEDTFFRRLERDLATMLKRPVEVIAIGASGWGQAHELFALDKEGLTYSPDLVIAEFLAGNDIRDNEDDLDRLANERDRGDDSIPRKCFVSSMRMDFLSAAFACDHIEQLLKSAGLLNDQIDDYDVYRKEPHRYRELWSEAWRRTEFAVATMNRLSAQKSARFSVVAFSTPFEIAAWAGSQPSGDLDGRLPTQRMAAICAKEKIPYLNLSERFAALPPAERGEIHMPGDGHWSSYGQQVAAEIIEGTWFHDSAINIITAHQ
jgi:hypothetical protein